MHVLRRKVQKPFDEMFSEHFRNPIEDTNEMLQTRKIPDYKKIKRTVDDFLEKLKEIDKNREKYEVICEVWEGVYAKVIKDRPRIEKIQKRDSRSFFPYGCCYFYKGRNLLSFEKSPKREDDGISAKIVIYFTTKPQFISIFSHEVAHIEYIEYGLSLLGPLKNSNTILEYIREKYQEKENPQKVKMVEEKIKIFYRKLPSLTLASLIEGEWGSIDHFFVFKAHVLEEEYARIIELLTLIDYAKEGKLETSGIAELINFWDSVPKKSPQGVAWKDLFGEKYIRDIKNKRWKLLKQFLKGNIEVADALIYELEKKSEELLKNYENQIKEIKSEIEKLIRR
jgi:hypothetical protein